VLSIYPQILDDDDCCISLNHFSTMNHMLGHVGKNFIFDTFLLTNFILHHGTLKHFTVLAAAIAVSERDRRE